MPKSDYTQMKKLGEGSFGNVFLMNHIKENKQYVMKAIDLSKLGPTGRSDALREIGFLQKLTHPYIVGYKEWFEEKGGVVRAGRQVGRFRGAPQNRSPPMLYIIMEFADGGDLADKIKKQNRKHFSEAVIVDWLVQICLSLKHVHDRKILHRDIKAQNIFLMKNGQIKMGDFGISKSLSSTIADAQTRIGTPYYLSPEICNGKPYNAKNDMWAVGVVLYEMCCLKYPFEAPSMNQLMSKIIRAQHSPVTNVYSRRLRQIIESLLQKDPKKRPNVNELLNNPLLLPIIPKWLPNDVIEQEFAHTILHKRKPLRPNVNVQQMMAKLARGDDKENENGNQQNMNNGNVPNGMYKVPSVAPSSRDPSPSGRGDKNGFPSVRPQAPPGKPSSRRPRPTARARQRGHTSPALPPRAGPSQPGSRAQRPPRPGSAPRSNLRGNSPTKRLQRRFSSPQPRGKQNGPPNPSAQKLFNMLARRNEADLRPKPYGQQGPARSPSRMIPGNLRNRLAASLSARKKAVKGARGFHRNSPPPRNRW